MKKYDFVILGGGLGGLLSGIILSREGYKVCVLEKNARLGGSIQSFAREGVIFNTGFNFTESLKPGETLYKYFKYFDILEGIDFQQMGEEAFEKISFSGDHNEYPLAQGYDNFVQSLIQYFPEEKENLEAYLAEMNRLCKSFPYYTIDPKQEQSSDPEFLTQSAHQRIADFTSNEKLQGILAGINSIYAGDKDYTPFYVHALINSSFIRSAWRIVGGSSRLIRRMADVIKANGGEIIRRAEVVKLSGEGNVIDHAELKDGEKIYAKHFISNLHPAPTLDLVDKRHVKRGQLARIKSLKNSKGMFTAYLVLKKESFPYLNHNIHHFKDTDVWTANHSNESWPHHYMLYTPASAPNEKWARGIQIITYLDNEELEPWKNTFTGNRGEEYEEFKRRKTEQLIDFVEERFPNTRSCIKSTYSATPLTYRDYTGTPDGAAYGILKNYKDPFSTIISPRSRVKNLFFTGQNLNMHGILGVSIGAVMTCAEFLGEEYLLNQINKAND